VAKVVSVEELRRSPMSVLFQGRDDIPLSVFVTEFPNGRGPDLHQHPYAELFLVEQGTAHFTIGDEELEVESGHFAIAPANTPHGFKNRRDEQLRVVSIQPSPEVVQTDL
jgi:mannose-6-phosphate isomerase-like protein (cupin superfamily)